MDAWPNETTMLCYLLLREWHAVGRSLDAEINRWLVALGHAEALRINFVKVRNPARSDGKQRAGQGMEHDSGEMADPDRK